MVIYPEINRLQLPTSPKPTLPRYGSRMHGSVVIDSQGIASPIEPPKKEIPWYRKLFSCF